MAHITIFTTLQVATRKLFSPSTRERLMRFLNEAFFGIYEEESGTTGIEKQGKSKPHSFQ